MSSSRDASRPDPVLQEQALLKSLVEIAEQTNQGKSVGAAVRTIVLRRNATPAQQNFATTDLMANWHTVSEFGLATPENIERMRAGKTPVVTIGGLRGQSTAVVPSAIPGGGAGTTYRIIPTALMQTIPPPVERSPAEQKSITAGLPGVADFFTHFTEVAKGESVKLQELTGSSLELLIDSVDPIRGVSYSLLDPTQLRMKSGLNESGNFAISVTPDAKTDLAPWDPIDIPRSGEKGVYLTTVNSFSIYLALTPGKFSERYRIAIVKGAKPRVEKPRTAEVIDLKIGQALDLKRFGKDNLQFVILSAKLHEKVTYLLGQQAQQQAATLAANPSKSILSAKAAAWGDSPIPNTKVSGMLITRAWGLEIYYVNAANLAQGTCRLCVIHDSEAPAPGD